MKHSNATNETLRELNRVWRGFDGAYHSVAVGMGLSDSALGILCSLYELGDGCLQKDVCAFSCTSKQTVNSSIRKLEREGIVRLETETGRGTHIHLTSAGRTFVEEHIVPLANVEHAAFSELSPAEQRELLRLMSTYLARFREHAATLQRTEGR